MILRKRMIYGFSWNNIIKNAGNKKQPVSKA
jgi:hypothetical protein